MLMRANWLAAGAMVAAIVPGVARGESIEEKLCLFSAAQKLPSVPGLTIVSASASPAEKRDGATKIVKSYPTLMAAANGLNEFGFVDAQLLEAIRYTGGQDRTPTVAGALSLALSGAANLEINVRALGRDASFGFACVWGPQRQIAVAPLGMLK